MSDRLSLTRGQKRAKLHILRGKDVFLSGGAGTGKTAVLKEIADELEQQGKSVVICAPTGTAALRIGGITIHSLFGFPAEVCINDGGQLRGFSIRTRTTDVVRNADVLIIDEISMVRVDLFDAIMASIEKMEKETGKHIQTIVSGDFYQLPPVLKYGSIDEERIREFYGTGEHLHAFQGHYWNKRGFLPIILDEVVRQDNSKFCKNLNLLRIGDPDCIPYFNANCCKEPLPDAPYLHAYNSEVEKRNLAELERLHGSLWSYQTQLSIISNNTLDDSVLASIPPVLILKEGADIVITENDHFGRNAEDISALIDGVGPKGPLYVNGTIGKVFELGNPGEPILIQTESGKLISLSPVTHRVVTYVADKNIGKSIRRVVATYTQYPLKLAYSLSIHRSQGQTLPKANVSPSNFGSGQLYVALSRVCSINGLYLDRQLTQEDIKVSESVKEFYARTQNGKVTRKMGRPTKSQTARSCLIWVPKPLEKHIRMEIEKERAIPLQYSPKYSSKRVHIRIPESMKEHITEEIKEWKNKTKPKTAQ